MPWEDDGGSWARIEAGAEHPIEKTQEHSTKRRRVSESYLHAFKDGPGTMVLEDLGDLLDRDLFDPDPRVTAYNLGARSVLLRIRKRMAEARKPPAGRPAN